MTTTKCDICQRPLEFNHSNPHSLEGEATFRSKDGLSTFPFIFTVEVTNFQFNTTNFHVCRDCLAVAILQGSLKV